MWKEELVTKEGTLWMNAEGLYVVQDKKTAPSQLTKGFAFEHEAWKAHKRIQGRIFRLRSKLLG